MTYAGTFFQQNENIDMTDVEWAGMGTPTLTMQNSDINFTPKVTSGYFAGVYDGNGKTIDHLSPLATNNKYCGGLFNAAQDAVIKNLTLVIDTVRVANASDEIKFGGLVGCSCNLMISNCTVKGTIDGQKTTTVGAFVSMNNWADDPSTIVDCVNEANVSGTKVGGFFGAPQNGCAFIRCTNKGTVTLRAGGTVVGAFQGNGAATYEDCVNMGQVINSGNALMPQFTRVTDEFGSKSYGTIKDDAGKDIPDTIRGLEKTGTYYPVVPIAGVNRARADSFAVDGTRPQLTMPLWFGDIETIDANGIITLIPTNNFNKGKTYKVMAANATIGAATVFTLAAEGDTISFDLSLVNDACTFTVGAAAGLKAEKGDVTDHVVTFTAVPDAVFPPNPDPSEIPTILEKATDTKLAANITSADDYAAFQTWATTIGQADVQASAYAWYSFALDQDALLTAEPEIDVDEVEVTSEGAFVLTVSVEDLTLGPKALVKAFGAQGTDKLGDSTKPFASDNVTVNTDTAKILDGKAVLEVTPAAKYETPAAFFFKAELK